MDKKDAIALPEGYDDEDDFLGEARERYQEGLDRDRDNRDAGLDDQKFLAGEQWDPQVESARKSQGRPCLKINTLPQFVAQVVGDIRINRPAIRVRPVEDADKALAETREGIIRGIERQSDAQGVYASAGQSQVGCGIGNFKIALDYAADDVFDRDIVIRDIPNPFAVVWDPLSTDPTGKDARYCFVTEEVERKAFEAMYGEAPVQEVGRTVGASDWMTKDVVRVAEYWIVKKTPVDLAQLPTGEVVKLSDVPPGVQPIRQRRSFTRSACMYLITGDRILEGPYELPIPRVPVIRVEGWVLPVEGRRVRFGLVRFAKDAARLRNYWRSVSAEVLAMAPKTQWLLHETEEGDQESFRNAHSSGDPVLTWNGEVPPQRVDPPPIPAAILQEAALNAQDLKDVTGLHDASLGARSNETSGKAIMARQREGDVATYIYHDNLQAAIREGGIVVNALIPVVYDTARTLRVVGEDENVIAQRVNDPTDDKAVDLSAGKYDIAVETGPSYSTRRVEAADSMMQFAQAVPQTVQVAGDLFAKAMDWPMADDIAERLKRAMPPQLTQDPNQPPPPPDPAQQMQAQMQQAQAQMAMQKMQLDLAESEAKTAKARADAVKAEAEAAKAQFETQMLVNQPVAPAFDQYASQTFGQGPQPTP